MDPNPKPTATPVSESRSRYALITALVGLLIPGLLIAYLAHFYKTGWTAAEITTVAGLFTGIVGTLVGAFLGVQAAVAGQQQAQAQTETANLRAAHWQGKAHEARELLTDAQRATL